MLTREKRSRPAGDGTATQKNAGQALTTLATTVPAATIATPLPEFTPEDAAAVARGAFVVVVQLDEDRHRRRVFLTLAAAERHAVAARERGHAAQVLLASLEPVGVIQP